MYSKNACLLWWKVFRVTLGRNLGPEIFWREEGSPFGFIAGRCYVYVKETIFVERYQNVVFLRSKYRQFRNFYTLIWKKGIKFRNLSVLVLITFLKSMIFLK